MEKSCLRKHSEVFFRSSSLCNKSPQAYNRLLAFHPLTFALVGYMCTHTEVHKCFCSSNKEGPLFKKNQHTVQLHISEDACCFDTNVMGVRAQLMGLFIFQITYNPCVYFNLLVHPLQCQIILSCSDLLPVLDFLQRSLKCLNSDLHPVYWFGFVCLSTDPFGNRSDFFK